MVNVRVHAPLVAVAEASRRVAVVVTENHRKRTATSGCIVRLRPISSITLTNDQRYKSRRLFLSFVKRDVAAMIRLITRIRRPNSANLAIQ